jgi:hypothetical protein
MARTRRTVRKSTGHPAVGQVAPRNVPWPQESQPNMPQHASHDEEPFVIELVVPKSPVAQGSPTEEEQQLKNHDIEDMVDEDHPPKQHGE